MLLVNAGKHRHQRQHSVACRLVYQMKGSKAGSAGFILGYSVPRCTYTESPLWQPRACRRPSPQLYVRIHYRRGNRDGRKPPSGYVYNLKKMSPRLATEFVSTCAYMWEFCLTLTQILCIVLVFSVLDGDSRRQQVAVLSARLGRRDWTTNRCRTMKYRTNNENSLIK